MYHIKTDKRCQKSADRIAAALKELLEVKSITDISVTDVQRVSGVGRSTFYRLFDNVDDVLLYLAETEFKYMADRFHEMNWYQFVEDFIASIAIESRGIINLASAGKMHILSKALRTNLTREAQKNNYEFNNMLKYQIAIFVGSCITLVTAWDENGRKESIEELAQVMQSTLDFKNVEKSFVVHYE